MLGKQFVVGVTVAVDEAVAVVLLATSGGAVWPSDK